MAPFLFYQLLASDAVASSMKMILRKSNAETLILQDIIGNIIIAPFIFLVSADDALLILKSSLIQ
jgi:hypothetical protein